MLGRKGAGKTAFLLGEGWSKGHHVVAIKAHNVFSVMDGIRVKWAGRSRGALFLDQMVSLWEAVLVHSAMRGLLSLRAESTTRQLAGLKGYLDGLLAGFDADQEDGFVFALGQRILDEVDTNAVLRPTADILAGMRGGPLAYTEARQLLCEVLAHTEPLDVIVDNLEDLHMHVDRLAPVLAGLFRIVARLDDTMDPLSLPFELRFAFPGEMLSNLRKISENPEKDFKSHVLLDWTAKELIDLVGERLVTSLNVNFDVTNDRLDGLDVPLDADPSDVLRAVLPAPPFHNGLGVEEDPLGYVLRHTQLLPRHLIHILNAIIGPVLDAPSFRRVDATNLTVGVRGSEDVIVDGVLSAYKHDYPYVGDCLARMQNKLESFVFTERDLQQAYNEAGVRKLTGERYEDFQRAALGIGAFGLVRAVTTERYVVADFAYIEGSRSLQPMPHDSLCVHPLFVHRLFDRRGPRVAP